MRNPGTRAGARGEDDALHDTAADLICEACRSAG